MTALRAAAAPTPTPMPLARPVVIDTNVMLGFVLPPDSHDRQLVGHVLAHGQVVQSPETASELAAVLARPEFDRYLPPAERAAATAALLSRCRLVAAPSKHRRCRDADDNKFLDLADAAQAQFLVTEDRELLRLNPFYGVTILAGAAFLRRLGLTPLRRGGRQAGGRAPRPAPGPPGR